MSRKFIVVALTPCAAHAPTLDVDAAFSGGLDEGLDAFLYDRTTDTTAAITSPFPPAFVGTIPHDVAEATGWRSSHAGRTVS